jgi:hypothetical protein
VPNYPERRQQSWDTSVTWAREHPKLSTVALYVVQFMVAASLLFAIAALSSAQPGEAVFWLVSAGFGGWLSWSWMRIRRGEDRPTTWRG